VRTRFAVSIALTVIGATLLLVGGLALYAREEIVDDWVDGLPPPVEANEKVTTLDALLERARACKRELGRVPNLFPVDQYDRGDIVDAAAQLNGLTEGSSGSGSGGESAGESGAGADAG